MNKNRTLAKAIGMQLLFLVVLMPLMIYLTTPIHEAGHALGALLGGIKVVEFDPFNHVITSSRSYDNFWMVCLGADIAIFLFFIIAAMKTKDKKWGIVFIYCLVQYGCATLSPSNGKDFSGYGENEGCVQFLMGLAYFLVAIWAMYKRAQFRIEKEEAEEAARAREQARKMEVKKKSSLASYYPKRR